MTNKMEKRNMINTKDSESAGNVIKEENST